MILIRYQTLNKYAILPSEIKTLKGGHSHETYRCCWPFETGRDKGANAIFRKSPAISTMASNLYYSYQRLKAEEVSELVGVCTGTVHQWVHQYNHKGPDVFILQGRGGRRRELLSWNEEEELLEELRERGERGAIVIAKTIREYAAKKLGTEVSQRLRI